MKRAIKHYMIAVEGGHSGSLERVKQLYVDDKVTKDVYAKALRAYQEYVKETRSPQRDEAAASSNNYKYY